LLARFCDTELRAPDTFPGVTTKNTSEVPSEQGAALIDLVIEKVRKEGFRSGDGPKLGEPRPLPTDAIEALRFPNGERPSPSLRRWLAFDASWLAELGWFDDLAAPVLKPCSIGEFAAREYGDDWGQGFSGFRKSFGGDLYLLPEGSDSRRALYVGKPDSLGEHPVAVTDNDDMPYVGMMYPGFDVYMAHFTRLITLKFGTYEALHEHPVYGPRMAEHAKNNLGGHASLEFGAEEAAEMEVEEPPPWKAGDPVPAGWKEARNPFTGQALLTRKK
jgi:hypothetical protein